MGSVQIPLSKGKLATIDEEDLEIVTGMAWHAVQAGSEFYAAHTHRISPTKCERIYMHRLILKPPEGMLVDHVNRDTLDNRRCNLRFATKGQNAANSKQRNRLHSRYRGVSQWRGSEEWIAIISRNNATISLGSYANEADAARAYNAAALAFLGEFAQLNEIDGVPSELAVVPPDRARAVIARVLAGPASGGSSIQDGAAERN